MDSTETTENFSAILHTYANRSKLEEIAKHLKLTILLEACFLGLKFVQIHLGFYWESWEILSKVSHMKTQVDKIHFHLNMSILSKAFSKDLKSALGVELLKNAKRQNFLSMTVVFSSMFYRLGSPKSWTYPQMKSRKTINYKWSEEKDSLAKIFKETIWSLLIDWPRFFGLRKSLCEHQQLRKCIYFNSIFSLDFISRFFFRSIFVQFL